MRLSKKRPSPLDKLFEIIETRPTSDRVLLRVLFFAVIFSGILFLYNLNKENSFLTPTSGGVLTEGIIGIPRFINPALAIARADQDVTALLYSGLLKIDQTGNLVPDLAESVSISEDGLTYQVVMKKNRSFHDGRPITARDVIYTIELLQNPDLKSPLRGNWGDVMIEEINEYEFNLVLSAAYSPFIENLTLGIMPHHIWSAMPIEQLPFSQYNTDPIGSGPFKIEQVNRDEAGLIRGYNLIPATTDKDDSSLSAIEIRFFVNETDLLEAFLAEEINATVYLSAASLEKLNADDINVLKEPLPRVFGIFLNQNRSVVLRDRSVRLALSAAIDRDRLVKDVLQGLGIPTTKPIIAAEGEIELNDTEVESNADFSLEAATQILIDGGWKKNTTGFWEKEIDESVETLSVTLKTSNSSLFAQTVEIIAENWRELGVEIQVEQYEQADLVQSAIRNRDFQALLFGLDMNRSLDLYPFWHSSQKDDPGLNISQYTNIAIDRLLEKTRNSQNEAERQQLLFEISEAISEEVPAIFLFTPSLAYVTDKEVVTTPITSLGKPSDRFMNVSNWHAKTEVIWPLFQKENIVNNVD